MCTPSLQGAGDVSAHVWFNHTVAQCAKGNNNRKQHLPLIQAYSMTASTAGCKPQQAANLEGPNLIAEAAGSDTQIGPAPLPALTQ
jgi:hypothetical protein